MNYLRCNFYLVLILVAAISLSACKAKKKVIAPAAENPPPTESPAPVQQQPAPPVQTAPPPTPAPPDYNFTNIQFEFDSGILKTESYPILDKAAAEMKKDPSATFILKGYASAEGSDAHNMQLSVDRANAVKTYLVNTGVSGANLFTKGFGEANPIADNNTDAGRIKNRRVEMKKQ